MCQSIDKQTLLWRISENKKKTFVTHLHRRQLTFRDGINSENTWQVRCPIRNLQSVIRPELRLPDADLAKFLSILSFVYGIWQIMLVVCPLCYLRKFHSQQFLFCGNNHNPLTCFLMLLQYWLTPIRRVLIAAAYLVKVKIHHETYFSGAWYKLYAPLGPLRVDSVSRATGHQYFIYYRHQQTHRY